MEQPKPNDGHGPDIVDLVNRDLEKRKAAGIETYGVPLRAGNGRDALWDAYEEALDLCCYLRQAIAERDEDKRLSKKVPYAWGFWS